MDDTSEVELYLHEHIPLSQHMQVRVISCDAHGVLLSAPLLPNINHRHTMFGGSASARAILAGWTWLHMQLKDVVEGNRLVIQSNTMHYLQPIEDELQAFCAAPPDVEWQRFVQTLQRRSMARLTLRVELSSRGKQVGKFEGVYAAMKVERNS
jgi:thioesterase domain-containing protein